MSHGLVFSAPVSAIVFENYRCRRGRSGSSLASCRSDRKGGLGDGGVLKEFIRLKSEKLVSHIGLTGFGHNDALAQVVDSGAFETVQAPYNILNPSAGRHGVLQPEDKDYGNIIGRCASHGMGVFAIRVFAGGAVAGRPPSAHTLRLASFR